MPKKKEVELPEIISVEASHKVHPIDQEFGNGELNILRDKINEIIANS